MTANELADKLIENNSVPWGSCTHEQHDNDKYFKEQAATMLRQQQSEIEALKKAIVEYADCVGSMEGTDFIGNLKCMGTSEESLALLYKLNSYDENGYWIHKEKASEK